MPGRRTLLALLILVSLPIAAEAQIAVAPPIGVPGIPVLVPDGVGFRYRGRHLSVSGFFSTGGYSVGVIPAGGFAVGPVGPLVPIYPAYPLPTAGYIDGRTTIHVITPTIILPPRPTLGVPLGEADLSGVDLDREPSPLHELEGKPRLAAKEPAKERAPKREEKEKPVPPPLVPPVPEKKLPREEEMRPLEEGLKSFREEDFGLAALHFQRAALAAPGSGEPFFLLAQAYVAQGKYRDAFAAIEEGLKRDPAFPTRDFRPRALLYKDMDAEYVRELKVLDILIAEHPADGSLLFLKGYFEWFEGRRAEARKTLTRARPLLADPALADRFLKVADGLVVLR